jgi:hypothetical protein
MCKFTAPTLKDERPFVVSHHSLNAPDFKDTLIVRDALLMAGSSYGR